MLLYGSSRSLEAETDIFVYAYASDRKRSGILMGQSSNLEMCVIGEKLLEIVKVTMVYEREVRKRETVYEKGKLCAKKGRLRL